MSGKKKKAAGKAESRVCGRLTRHEWGSVQRMLERGASCRQIARELGRSPSTVSSEVASHRFVTAPKAWRGERVDATFSYLAKKRRLASIETLLRLSRLPRREPKTFEGFDFSRIQGRDAATLGKLPSLADLYAHRNVAFVGAVSRKLV